KNQPGRLASELAYQRMDPLGQGYYQVAEPRAWVYLRDGRTIYVRSREARIKRAATTKEIESGEFRGGVLVRVFPRIAAPVGGAGGEPRPIDPETDTPALNA